MLLPYFSFVNIYSETVQLSDTMSTYYSTSLHLSHHRLKLCWKLITSEATSISDFLSELIVSTLISSFPMQLFSTISAAILDEAIEG